jgi:putative ABC transport system permease protein
VPQAGLSLRAAWWRRGASITLLAVAIVTTASAALGPLYARSASESTLRDQLNQAPAETTGLSFQTTGDGTFSGSLTSVQGTTPPPGSLLGYPTRISEMEQNVRVTDSGPQAVLSRAVWRQDACTHVRILSGRCPSGPQDAMVSSRTVANSYGIKLGSALSLGGLDTSNLGPDGTDIETGAKVKVVGIYQPVNTNDPFWFGRQYFNAHLYSGAGDGPDTIDSIFIDQSLFQTLTPGTIVTFNLDYPLDSRQVRLANEPQMRAQVASLQTQYGSSSDDAAAEPQQLVMSTGLGSVLDAADHERSILQASTILVTLQLTLLAWLVLFQVMTDSAESRGNEIALAKLRGIGSLRTITFALGEPLSILVIAVPFGLVGALAITAALAHMLFLAGTPVVMTWGAVAAALVGLAGGGVAALLASWRVLTRSILEQWRRTPGHKRTSLWLLAVDLVLVLAAVGGLILLRATGSSQAQPRPASLLAPGLLILTIALVGVRIVPLVGRSLLGPTRASRRVGAFLAVRQVTRRPAGLRLSALLAVAIGLAVFAVDGESVAAQNRETRAGLELGAAQVVSVQFSTTHDPRSAVAAADPEGKWAMAVAQWQPDGGALTGEVVAVQSARLNAVANWPAGNQLTAGQVANTLAPPTAPALMVVATRLRIHLDVESFAPSGQAPIVRVEVAPKGQVLQDPEAAGVVALGPHTYEVEVPCAQGCDIRRLILQRPGGYQGELSGSAIFTGIDRGTSAGWVPVDAGFTTPAYWRDGAEGNAKDTLTLVGNGLRTTFTSQDGASPAIARADTPTPIPVVATAGGLVTDAPQPPTIEDIGSESTFVTAAATVPLLPAALDSGALVDLTAVAQQLPGFGDEAQWQVWLAPDAPSDAVAKLASAGLIVQGIDKQSAREAELARQGPSLALLLLVACAIAGAVLAAGATVLAVAVNGRRRSFELAALTAIGVSRRSLLRSCVGEQIALLGAGLLLGIPAGLVAAWIALPAIPESSAATPIPLQYVPNIGVVALFTLVVAVILVLVSVVAGASLMRTAVPIKLREGAQ